MSTFSDEQVRSAPARRIHEVSRLPTYDRIYLPLALFYRTRTIQSYYYLASVALDPPGSQAHHWLQGKAET